MLSGIMKPGATLKACTYQLLLLLCMGQEMGENQQISVC